MTDQWAYDRVRQIVDAQTKPGWADDNMPTGVSHAFARYVSEHEEPPFADMVKDILRDQYPHIRSTDGKLLAGEGPGRVEDILKGKGAAYWEMKLALAALKRGIEIGKAQP